ncbi:MAG TPA: hypothetical protein VEB63_02915 [Chitinophagaceae bacterium]|nr:hypothetical protein [Chitinophagaceae bacterium]
MKIPTVLTFTLAVVGWVAGVRAQSFSRVVNNQPQWTAQCSKLANLTPPKGSMSLKKFYLEKLKNASVTAYRFVPGEPRPTVYQLSMPKLERQEWLKGLVPQPRAYKNPKEWVFIDPSKTSADPDWARYHVPDLGFSEDSCCGCDDAEAFRLRQVLSYQDGAFLIQNLLIAPLCARRSAKGSLDWYPLCEVAYCDQPLESGTLTFIGTDVLDYQLNRDCKPVTRVEKNLVKLVMHDFQAGRLEVTGAEGSENIPVTEFLTWDMPVDTLVEYDGAGNARWKTVRKERSLNAEYRFRIEQDFYFNAANEKLYSRVKSVLLMEPIFLPNGQLRGYRPLYRLEKLR